MASIFYLDVTGLPCPQPVLKTKAVLDGGHQGPLTVGLDNESSAVNVASYLQGKGLRVQTYGRDDRWLVLGHEPGSAEILVWYGPDGWRAEIEDQDRRAEVEPVIDLVQPATSELPVTPPALEQSAEKDDTVVMAGSQFMGQGNEELGARLALSLFDTLAASGRPPTVIAFYNSGVHLTTRESPLIETLRDLEKQGSLVITSGLCLEALNLKDQLKVGRVGNMYEIVNAQRTAAHTITI